MIDTLSYLMDLARWCSWADEQNAARLKLVVSGFRV